MPSRDKLPSDAARFKDSQPIKNSALSKLYWISLVEICRTNLMIFSVTDETITDISGDTWCRQLTQPPVSNLAAVNSYGKLLHYLLPSNLVRQNKSTEHICGIPFSLGLTFVPFH
jgi:hypothetical protein